MDAPDPPVSSLRKSFLMTPLLRKVVFRVLRELSEITDFASMGCLGLRVLPGATGCTDSASSAPPGPGFMSARPVSFLVFIGSHICH